MSTNATRYRLLFALSLTVVFWASAFSLIKSAGAVYGAGELACLRFTIASLMLALYGMVIGVRLPRGRDVPWFLLSGLLGVTLYHPFLNYGEHVVSAGAASLLINSAPVWTALLAVPLMGEKLTVRSVAGIALSFTGVTLLTFSKNGGISFQLESLLILASAFMAALYVLLQKRFLSHYGAVEFTLYTFGAGVLLLYPFFLISTVRTVMQAPLRPTLEIAYLGIFPAAIAYMMFAYATVRMPASRVMTTMYLVPPVTMVVAFLYLREQPTALSLVGGLLAIAGVAVVNTARLPKAAEKAEPVVAIEEA
jgi:drug/metabolite transporter (DMT)-like permease